jgi:hypothetical protein
MPFVRRGIAELDRKAHWTCIASAGAFKADLSAEAYGVLHYHNVFNFALAAFNMAPPSHGRRALARAAI